MSHLVGAHRAGRVIIGSSENLPALSMDRSPQPQQRILPTQARAAVVLIFIASALRTAPATVLRAIATSRWERDLILLRTPQLPRIQRIPRMQLASMRRTLRN